MSDFFQNTIFTTWNDSIYQNTVITLYMVLGTMLFSVVIGVPLGLLLYETSRSTSAAARTVNRVVGFVVNVGRSFPFIILIIALIPFTRAIVGRSTGPVAAMVPLTIAAIPFLARLIEINLREVSAGKLEAVTMMGAGRWELWTQVLLREALPGIIGSLTTTTIAVTGYTAMAGTVGGKGLGDLAYRKGYNGYDPVVMTSTVVVLILIVIVIQVVGDRVARRVDHRAAA